MKYLKFCLILFIVLFGCSNNDIQHEDGFGNYDLSRDGKSIVFSWVINGKSEIYKSDIKGHNTEKIFSAENGASFFNPRYSNDGRMIVFVSNETNSLNSAVCTGDMTSRKIEMLTDTFSIKTEAIFSSDDKGIFFCAANEYGSNSPLARNSARGFDVYSINLSNGENTKVTNLNAYSLSGLSLNSDSVIAFHVFAGEDGGVFQYNLFTKMLHDRINADSKSDPPGAYRNPMFVGNGKMYCLAYGRLLLLDLKTNKGKVVFSSNFNIANTRYSSKLHRIFFTRENSDGTIYSIDESGQDLKELNLKP